MKEAPAGVKLLQIITLIGLPAAAAAGEGVSFAGLEGSYSYDDGVLTFGETEAWGPVGVYVYEGGWMNSQREFHLHEGPCCSRQYLAETPGIHTDRWISSWATAWWRLISRSAENWMIPASWESRPASSSLDFCVSCSGSRAIRKTATGKQARRRAARYSRLNNIQAGRTRAWRFLPADSLITPSALTSARVT